MARARQFLEGDPNFAGRQQAKDNIQPGTGVLVPLLHAMLHNRVCAAPRNGAGLKRIVNLTRSEEGHGLRVRRETH